MKWFILVAVALGLCFYSWLQIGEYPWVPAAAPRWNPLALKESGFGRTLARVLTEQANTSYHHGLFEHKPPTSTNPISRWLDAGNAALGFQGRLKYRPTDQYPLCPYEVKQALEQAEKNLRVAFELDPGNFTAYDVYFFFLTNEVSQTEFASLGGTQLKDEDDDDPARDSRESQHQGPRVAEDQGKSSQTPPGNNKNEEPVPQAGVFRRWAQQEQMRRHARAIEITDEAIRKFRPNTLDPERFLTAAVMHYNRFMLLAPDPEARQKSAEARRKFDEVGPPTLNKINYYLAAASACQHDLEQKGLWQALPERRAEFLQVMKLLQKCAYSLSVALTNNRLQMLQDPSGLHVPLGQN